MKSSPPHRSRAGTLSRAHSATRVPGQCWVSLLRSWDSRSPARGAGGYCRLFSCIRDTRCLTRWPLASTQTGDAPGSIGPTSGTIPALQRAPGSPSLGSARSLPPRGSGREGGVSGAGGRELYKKRWRRSSPGFICCLSPGLRVPRESNGQGRGAALELPNAGTICSRCSCNMLELQNS